MATQKLLRSLRIGEDLVEAFDLPGISEENVAVLAVPLDDPEAVVPVSVSFSGEETFTVRIDAEDIEDLPGSTDRILIEVLATDETGVVKIPVLLDVYLLGRK